MFLRLCQRSIFFAYISLRSSLIVCGEFESQKSDVIQITRIMMLNEQDCHGIGKVLTALVYVHAMNGRGRKNSKVRFYRFFLFDLKIQHTCKNLRNIMEFRKSAAMT